MLQLYNSHYLVLCWKFRHIINVICFKQRQLVVMKHSLKFITMIVYKYIHIYIYICITGGPYLFTKPAITDKVNSVDVIELSNVCKQATILLSAHCCCLFSMHDLATSSWVSPLAFCVAVIWHSQESAEDTISPLRGWGMRSESTWKWTDPHWVPAEGWLCPPSPSKVLPSGTTQSSVWRLELRENGWEIQAKSQSQQDHFRGFKNGLKLSWPML